LTTDLADRPFQSIGGLRNRGQMDMIGHQAARPDLDLVSAAPSSHQFQVALVIFVTKENLLPAVSALSDVCWGKPGATTRANRAMIEDCRAHGQPSRIEYGVHGTQWHGTQGDYILSPGAVDPGSGKAVYDKTWRRRIYVHGP
jgi:hypothetical protein